MKSTCDVCASDKIIPEVRIMDQGQNSDGMLKVEICGSPNAKIFKDRLHGELKAYICGNCGHTGLRVSNPEALYLKYQESIKSSHS